MSVMRFKDQSWSEAAIASAKPPGSIATSTARFDLLDLEVMMKRGGCGFVPDDQLCGETPAGVAQHRLLPLGDPDLLGHVSLIEWENVILYELVCAQPGRHSLKPTLKGYFYTNLVGTLETENSLALDPGRNISAPRRPCLTRPEAASTCNRPHLAFAYCGLSMIRVIAGLKGSSCSPALSARAIPASAMIPNTPNARQLRQSGMVTPKPPSSSAMASAVNSVCSASRSISSVPGFAEHPHPVASQDFRDVDERVAAAQQFRAEEWEVRYLIEILDVLE